MSKQGVGSRYWVFTSFHHNDGFLWYDPDTMEYLVQQEEFCPKTQKEHWQGAVVFDKRQRLSALKKLLPKAHWEVMRGGLVDASWYCTNPEKRIDRGLFLEDGLKPVAPDQARGDSTRERYKRAYDLAIEGKLREIEPSMMVRHLSNLCRLSTMFGTRPANINRLETPGVWLVGGAGVGKTTLVQKFLHYSKDPRHKWFDGYAGETCVVVDDFAPFHVAQTDILKQLGHQFAFQGEVKGGSTWLRPLACVVTSQYMIHTIWEKDLESVEAIRRRYKSFSLPMEADEAEAYIRQLLVPTIIPECSVAAVQSTSPITTQHGVPQETNQPPEASTSQ